MTCKPSAIEQKKTSRDERNWRSDAKHMETYFFFSDQQIFFGNLQIILQWKKIVITSTLIPKWPEFLKIRCFNYV